MRFPRPLSLLAVCLTLSATVGLFAATEPVSEKRLELLFRPPTGERMALSADGRFMAYTVHENGGLTIIITDLERRVISARILADEDRPILHSKEKRRARLRYLEWADNQRLVFAPEVEIIGPPTPPPDVAFIEIRPDNTASITTIPPPEQTVIAPVMAVDADGRNPRELVDGKTFQTLRPTDNPAEIQARSRQVAPLIRGFAVGDRAHLLVEVPGYVGQPGRSAGIPTELHRVNIRTGQTTELHSEPGIGHLTYDQNGLPRLSRESGPNLNTSFLVRAPDSSRWIKLAAPAGAPPQSAFAVTPQNYFGERAIPLGFDLDPNVLIYASNVGRDTFGIYGLNVKTRTRTALSLEHPRRDLVALDASAPSDALVFDRHRRTLAGVRAPGSQPFTVWLDAELATVQHAATEKFPQRSVQLIDWDAARDRFLVQVTGGAEPGRTFQFQRPENLMVELFRGARWLPAGELHTTRYVEFTGPEGAELSGFLTLPRSPRLQPPPLIIWFATGLPPQPHPEFDAQAQAFGDLGFVVFRLNQRGVAGFGSRQREALRRDFDRTPAADALAAIEWIATQHRIDRKRVATFGEGVAGHFAVRSTQLHPGVFRCAILFDPILDLAAWVQPSPDSLGPPSFTQEVNRHFLTAGGAKLAQLATTAHADDHNAAVFIASPTVARNATEQSLAAAVGQLRSQLTRRDIPCTAVEHNDDFTQGLPAARARVYRALDEFLNLNLYQYDVKIGPAKVIK